MTESKGGLWSESTSEARNFKPHFSGGSAGLASSGSGGRKSSGMSGSQSCTNFGSGGSNGSGYQNGVDFNSASFKAQKEDFFGRKQAENDSRPE